jgi:hypothetical protein
MRAQVAPVVQRGQPRNPRSLVVEQRARAALVEHLGQQPMVALLVLENETGEIADRLVVGIRERAVFVEDIRLLGEMPLEMGNEFGVELSEP